MTQERSNEIAGIARFNGWQRFVEHPPCQAARPRDHVPGKPVINSLLLAPTAMIGCWHQIAFQVIQQTLQTLVTGLEHNSGTRNPTPKRGLSQVVTRSSLTLRIAGLSLLAFARLMIKADFHTCHV